MRLGPLIGIAVKGAAGAYQGAEKGRQTRRKEQREDEETARRARLDALAEAQLLAQSQNLTADNERADWELKNRDRAAKTAEVAAMRARILSRFNKPPVDPRIDPLSAEGIKARIALHRGTQDPAKPGTPGGAGPVKTTGDERKGAGWLIRAQRANAELSGDPDKGIGPMPTESAWDPIARFITPEPLEGFTTTKRSRNREPSEKAFLSAVLRKDTGAVISDIEYDDGIRQYFERATDSEVQRATKRRNRETAIEELQKYGGRAVDPAAPADESTEDFTSGDDPVTVSMADRFEEIRAANPSLPAATITQMVKDEFSRKSR